MSYSPTIGRFLEEDPAGYIDGSDEYQLERSNGIDQVDPTGLATGPTQSQSTPSSMVGTPVLLGTARMHLGFGLVWPSPQRSFTPDPSSAPSYNPGRNNSLGYWLYWGKDDQTGERWQYSVILPPPPPTPTDVAKQQLNSLKAWAQQFQDDDESWSMNNPFSNRGTGNECEEQAGGLSRFLSTSPYWTDEQLASRDYWDFTVIGGTTNWGMPWSHHNVVLLTPKNGNTLPPNYY